MKNQIESKAMGFFIVPSNSSIKLVPITTELQRKKNYYSVVIDQTLRFNQRRREYEPFSAEATIKAKHGEVEQTLTTIKEKTVEELIEAIKDWVSKNIFNMQGYAA